MHKMQDYSSSPEKLEMHNTFLGILIETGILGFASFVLFIAIILFKAALKYLKMKSLKYKAYLSMLVLGLVSNMMYTMVQFGLRSRYMWLGLALAASITLHVEK